MHTETSQTVAVTVPATVYDILIARGKNTAWIVSLRIAEIYHGINSNLM
jgi:hypothetical protein